jgi:two-component system, OmpR family, phosphate regulon sensor histidine kinase PhoR
MKYRRFRWLLAGMSLALTGIILLQVYWLAKAYRAEENRFSALVRTAVADATMKLEGREALTLLSKAMISLPEDSLVTDTVIAFHQHVVAAPPMPPMPPAPPAMHAHPSDSESRLVMHEMRVAGDCMRVATERMKEAGDSFNMAMERTNVVVVQRANRLKTAVKDVYMRYVQAPGKTFHRVTRDDIRQALDTSFRLAGISAPYAYLVTGPGADSLHPVRDGSERQRILEQGVSVPLFPADLHAGSQALVVRVDNDALRILGALFPQLAIALVLTSALVLVFFFTYREALRQKKISEIRNDFINNMTHEFKTPIATISLAADTVLNPAVTGDAEKVRHFTEVIKRENRRMNEQVEKVLELALAERNELRLEKEPVDVCAVVARAVQAIALQVTARGGDIRSSGNCPGFVIDGDAFHLERAFLNILDNAVKYSPSGPQVVVSCEAAGDTLAVLISDNGVGFPEEEAEKIFDRFYRVSLGDRHDVKGFGLGLSYAKTIFSRHGAVIAAESKPGQGSTFTVTFVNKGGTGEGG